MADDEFATDDALTGDSIRRGLSRRQMIKASAIAGAAAWTAPVIIDSLASPAAAASGCTGNKYYMKLVGRGSGLNQNTYDPGDCYNASPLCNNTTKFTTGGNAPDSSVCNQNDNYTWVCTSGSPPNNHTNKFRSAFVDSNSSSTSAGTYTVTLAAGCTFDSTKTAYTAVANYNWTGSGGECQAVATTNGSNQIVFNKSVSSGTKILDYMYFEFVCV